MSCTSAVARVAAGLLIATCAGAPAAAERPADLVLRGGAVYTLDAARSWAAAVAVRGGRIVHVGTNADAQGFVGPGTEVVELGGKMVLPGFHDSHVHPVTGGIELDRCDLNAAESADEALAIVRRYTAEHPERVWIGGGGYPLPIFPEGIAGKEALDEATGERPAYLTSGDGHSAWVNSKALALAGVTAKTPDPPNGRIERTAEGEPAGTLRESAMDLVARLVPPDGPAEHVAGLERALALAHRFGITSWVEAAADDAIADAYLTLAGQGRLTVRTMLSLTLGEGEKKLPIETLIARRERYRAANLRADAVKIFVDGVIEGRTAALLAPYLGLGPGREEFRGELNFAPDELTRRIVALDRAGFDIHAHTIGDRAIRVTLEAIEAARRENGERDRRPQLAHIQLFDPADVPRFRKLGAIADFQPLWCYADSYMTELTEPVLGPARSRWQYPIRSLFASGAVVVAGSDWSVTSMNPLDAIEVALTHRPPGEPGPPWNPDERVGLPEILAAYTVNGAYLVRQEKETGSIEIGKAADLIVLDRNLFEVEPRRIHEVRVLRTILAGATVWRAAGD